MPLRFHETGSHPCPTYRHAPKKTVRLVVATLGRQPTQTAPGQTNAHPSDTSGGRALGPIAQTPGRRLQVSPSARHRRLDCARLRRARRPPWTSLRSVHSGSSWTSIAHPYNSPSKSTAPSIDTEGDRTNSEHAFSHRSGRRLALLAEVHVGPRARSDASPAARIENYGVKIIRFASEDILDDVDQVIRAIRSALPERQSPCCLG